MLFCTWTIHGELTVFVCVILYRLSGFMKGCA